MNDQLDPENHALCGCVECGHVWQPFPDQYDCPNCGSDGMDGYEDDPAPTPVNLTCPDCGGDVEPEWTVCRWCDSALFNPAPTPVNTDRICPECGNTYDWTLGSDICPYCDVVLVND